MASLAKSRSVRVSTPKPALKSRGRTGIPAARPGNPVSLGAIMSNWAALVALWALPYLALLEFLRLDAAHSQALQWSLVAVGTLGLGSLLLMARKLTRDPMWRARHGLRSRERPKA